MRMIIAVLLMTGAASASEQEAINNAAFRLGLTYHCIPLTNDVAEYEKQKGEARRILSEAKVTSTSVDAIIASLETQKQNGTGSMTAELCAGLISSLE